jgi:hypothetical protein
LICQSDLVLVMYFLLLLTFLTQLEFPIKTKWMLTICIFTQKSPHQHGFIFAQTFAPNVASRSYTYVNCPLAPKTVTFFYVAKQFIFHITTKCILTILILKKQITSRNLILRLSHVCGQTIGRRYFCRTYNVF